VIRIHHIVAGVVNRFTSHFSDDSSASGRAREGLDWQLEYFEFEVEDNGIGIADEDYNQDF
jgi:signal transduction histidine kinase